MGAQHTAMGARELSASIRQGCAALGADFDETVITRLVNLVLLLDKWNRVYNLTAVRDPQTMVTRHILDSLVVLPYLCGNSLLDVGTGAGLPGLPFAIARPGCAVTLLDANAKKLRFVRQAVVELGLTNAEIVQSRMEQYRPAQAFDMVVSRAVADIGELYRQTAHLVRPGGRMLFLKGVSPDREIAAFDYPEQLHVEVLKVPGLDAERHLVWCVKQQEPELIRQ